MRNYFTSLQVFMAGALAIVVFIGLLWAERTNFVKISSLEDPFTDQQTVNERVVVSTSSEARSWLHYTGEVFMVMPGGKFNLINQARELDEGVMFVNTAFQTQAGIEKAQQGLVPPFDIEGTRPKSGQIKIGPLMVSVPQGIAVLKRDLVRKEALIYAHDHPVNLAFPNAEESFIIPPGYMVLVKEDRAELFGSLFFTKLKKELNLETLEPDSLGMESVQSSLLQGLELSNVWEQQMIDYAEAYLVSNNRFAPDSMMGKVLSALYYIQRYYALGIDDQFKADYLYSNLRQELKNAYFAFLENNQEASVESSQAFSEVRDSPEWARFFIENPQYESLWKAFAQNQRIWFYGSFPNRLEVPALRVLWGPSQSLNTFTDYQENFYLYETYVAKGYVVPARNQLEFLIENFENINFEALEDKNKLSQSRRQISLLLQQDPRRSSSLMYDLYVLMVNTERQFAVGETEADQEVRLEVAQELLFFLDQLLDSNTRQDDVYKLLEVYNNLNINQLAESLGRAVFSNRERETLAKISSLSNTTEEQRRQILEDNRSVNDLINAFEEIRSKEPENTVTVPAGIQTESDLTELFENSGILNQGIRVQVNEREGVKFFTFSQASYEGYSFSGTFNVESQQFSYLKLGEVEERRAPTTSNFLGFLRNMVKSNNELSQEEEPEDLGVNINTSRALIQRRLILKLLQEEGVSARFDNVIPTNEELTKAKISEATFEKTYLLNFDFDLGPPIRIRNVEVRYGRNVVQLPDRVFTLDDLGENLLKAIEDKTEQNSGEGA